MILLVSVLNVFSVLIIGRIFVVVREIAVFVCTYIPLRLFEVGYHARWIRDS